MLFADFIIKTQVVRKAATPRDFGGAVAQSGTWVPPNAPESGGHLFNDRPWHDCGGGWQGLVRIERQQGKARAS